MIRCAHCKHWDPKAREITLFFSLGNEALRRANHPAGIGLCTQSYSRTPPFARNEAFAWDLSLALPGELFTGPDYGCVLGKP